MRSDSDQQLDREVADQLERPRGPLQPADQASPTSTAPAATATGMRISARGRIRARYPVDSRARRYACGGGPDRRTIRAVPLTVSPLTAHIGAEVGGIDLADEVVGRHRRRAPRAAARVEGALLPRPAPPRPRPSHRVRRGRSASSRSIRSRRRTRSTARSSSSPRAGRSRRPGSGTATSRGGPSRRSARSCARSSCRRSAATRSGPTWGSPTTCSTTAPRSGSTALVALHDFTRAFGAGRPPEEQAKMRERYPTVEHPVVRTHPETGRKTLYVNPSFTDDDQGHGRGRGVPAPRPPRAPGHRPRRAGAVPLGARQRRVLGQPRHAARGEQRLPARTAA